MGVLHTLNSKAIFLTFIQCNFTPTKEINFTLNFLLWITFG